MSRSTKKNPIRGVTTAETEKEDKQNASRAERRANKQILAKSGNQDDLKLKREVSDPWSMDKDGKFRFDKNTNPELMRK